MLKAPDTSGAFSFSPPCNPQNGARSCQMKHPEQPAHGVAETAAERGVAVEIVAIAVRSAGRAADDQVGKHGTFPFSLGFVRRQPETSGLVLPASITAHIVRLDKRVRSARSAFIYCGQKSICYDAVAERTEVCAL
ncbi:hypothetical protein ACP4J4_14235 [Aureimonas ureilytica]|uniref:hypothetical protein n=1 Tax=Aureimonas ureilytica TaxID=401562 RepID=UPI003CF12427